MKEIGSPEEQKNFKKAILDFGILGGIGTIIGLLFIWQVPEAMESAIMPVGFLGVMSLICLVFASLR